MKSNLIYVLLITFVIGLILTACTSNQLNDKSIPQSTIRIGYFSEDNFKTRYSSLINNHSALANVSYTIIPTSELIKGKADVEAWSRENEFDLIYLPGPLVEDFMESGKLLKLDPIMKANEWNSDSFIPSFFELAKLYGQGSLYGLPPGIEGKAIVYNKDLFEKYKVNVPTDQMLWFDLIQLASDFPVAGLTVPTNNAFEFIWDIGHTNGYKAYREFPSMVTFNNQEWNEIWHTVREPLSKGQIITNEYFLNAFLEEEASMALITNRQYVELKKKKPDFEWGIATMPVSPDQINTTKYMYADGFYAISSSSSNQAAAIDWLKFFLSESALRSDERAGNLGMSTRKRELSDPFSEAVFKLKPAKRDILPFQYLELGEMTLQRLLTSSISVNEALDELQDKAEDLLQMGVNNG